MPGTSRLEGLHINVFAVNTQETKLLCGARTPSWLTARARHFWRRHPNKLHTSMQRRERTIFTQHPQQACIAKVASAQLIGSSPLQRQSRGRLMVS